MGESTIQELAKAADGVKVATPFGETTICVVHDLKLMVLLLAGDGDAPGDGIYLRLDWADQGIRAEVERRRLFATLFSLAAQLATANERIAELEGENEKIRDTAVSIELVRVATVDLTVDADGRDQAVLSTSRGIGLHRQHDCDAEGCGRWHVIARLPLSIESRAALFDLRTARDDANRERDEARLRIATLERELAEARQRDEDATDLILRQAALRPKAEAAERWEANAREYIDLLTGELAKLGAFVMARRGEWSSTRYEKGRRLRAALGIAGMGEAAPPPAEEPREVVEPAPATARSQRPKGGAR